MILHSSPQLVSKQNHIGSLKVSAVGVFASWKSEDATNWGKIHGFVNCLDALSSEAATSQKQLHGHSHVW